MFAKWGTGQRWRRAVWGGLALAMLSACGVSERRGAGVSSPVPLAVVLTATPEPNKQLALSWTGVAADATVVVQENLDGQSGFADSLATPAGGTAARLPVFLPIRWGAQYRLKACWALECQESAPVGLSGYLDSSVGYFKPAASGATGQFGAAVAVSRDGSTLAVGAPNSRMVELFAREGAAWRLQAALAAPEGVDGKWGASLALSGEGTVLAVGAPRDGAKGAVVLMSRLGETWSHAETLQGTGSGGDGYGVAVSLSSDGDYLAVGAPRQRQGSVRSGAVYAYVNRGGSWQALGAQGLSVPQPQTAFGTSVALSADGEHLLVGAPEAHSGLGAVHVYTLGRAAFHPSATLTGAQDRGEQRFGQSVAWAQHDGRPWMAVGAPCALSPREAPCVGAVHVWRPNAQGAWQQHSVLRAVDPGHGDLFGHSVSFSADASVLAVGVPHDAGASRGIGLQTGPQTLSGSGAAFVFRRAGGQWASPVAVKAPNAGRSDDFGRSVALAANGDTLAVGAPWEASAASGIGGDPGDDSQRGRGAVYLY